MAKKSGSKSGNRPGTFKGKDDPRNGRGPQPGAPNAGRPPSRIKALAAELVERKALIAVLGKIAVAELGEAWADKDGETVYGETKNTDRIAAIKLLLAYGDGLPTQRQELSGPEGGPIETLNADSPRDQIERKLAGIASRQAAARDAGTVRRGGT